MTSFYFLLLCCALVGHGRRLEILYENHELRCLGKLLLRFSPLAARVATSRDTHRMRPIELQQLRKSDRRALPAVAHSDDIMFREMGSDIKFTRQEAIAGLASLITLTLPRSALADELSYLGELKKISFGQFKKFILPKETDLKKQLVLLLRVQEACKQELRLVTTAKFKDLQRADISLAITSIIENYDTKRRFATAAALAFNDRDQQTAAFSLGVQTVDYLVLIQAYTGDPKKLKVEDLAEAKREFVLKSLDKASGSIETFLEKMPADVVAAAKEQVEEENRLNLAEFKDEQIVNLDPKYYKDGAVPVTQ